MKILACALLLLTATAGFSDEAVKPDEPKAGFHHKILPSDTDPAIDTFNAPHVFWAPAGKPRHQLLLSLPGTGGAPRADDGLCNTASELGYHVVNLSYPDGTASQAACSMDSDKDSYMKFRLGIIEGGQKSPHISVTRANSIENRLIKLLQYLDKKRPKEGWGQYLNDQGGIFWAKIAVAGHSQGGGHCAVIAKYHQVARVLMFGSPKDYSFHFKAPGGGFDSITETPLSCYFGFNHIRDDKNGCNHKQHMEIVKAMGLDRVGILTIDGKQPPYDNAHLLYTNCDIDLKKKKNGQPNYHGSVGSIEIKDANGQPRFKPVWTYMLTAPVN